MPRGAAFAALPMYDWPETREAVDREWAALRKRLRAVGIDAPRALLRRNGDLPPVPGGIRSADGSTVAPDPATLPPDALDLPTLWRHPALLVAQTCWGPMEQGLAAHVQVVGQPDYSRFEGGEGEFYSSAILMRREIAASEKLRAEPSASAPPLTALPGIPHPLVSPRLTDPASGRTGFRLRERGENTPSSTLLSSPRLRGEGAGRRMRGSVDAEGERPVLGVAQIVNHLRGKRLAFNGPDSMSGIIALRRDLEAASESLSLFAGLLETGSHRASLVTVAQGGADVCAVDCRTWDMAKRFEPAAQELEVVGWTTKRKGLPFVTSRLTLPETAAALREALA